MSVSAVHGVGCVSRQLQQELFSLFSVNCSFIWKFNSIHAKTGRLTPPGPEISRFTGPRGAAVVGK